MCSSDLEEFEWLSDGKARVAARLHIEDLAEKLEIEMSDEEREDVDTVGGFVTKKLGRVAIPGSEVELMGWKISAERPIGRRHRIATFLIERQSDISKSEEV